MASVVPASGEASCFFPPSTSIPPPGSYSYHVFLNFRGEDTRKGFTDHLCAALERKGIIIFRDDKDLERGEVISLELLKAIEESMFAIIILSANYASSTWCLDELQHIFSCTKRRGLSVMPIFYGVEPSNVRSQKGSFAKAFKKHEKAFGKNSDKVGRWRDALTQVASYAGWHTKDKHEAKLVECIAQDIHEKVIQKLPSSTKNPVWIASTMKEVISQIGNVVRIKGAWKVSSNGWKMSYPELEIEVNPKIKTWMSNFWR